MSFLPDIMVMRVWDITPEMLFSRGIKGLILDLDNTLTTHDNPIPDPKSLSFIKLMREHGVKLMILSNNKRERVEPFSRILDIDFVPRGLKPLPFGVRRVCRMMGLSPHETAMVGDQLFTDMYAGAFSGTKTIMVKYIEEETGAFLRFKRRIERKLLKKWE